MAFDDIRMIQGTLAGDSEAFGRLVMRYQDRLFHSLKMILRSEHDAADVAQDAFIQAYQKLHTFRHDASFYSWLFRIGYHAAINHRRKTKPHNVNLVQEFETEFVPSDPREDLSPSYSLESLDRVTQVQQALDGLPADYRDVLVLKEMEGLPYEEIALIVNCPIGTVRSRIHRARLMLREKLARVVEREQN